MTIAEYPLDVWTIYFLTQATDKETEEEIDRLSRGNTLLPDSDIRQAILNVHLYIRTGRNRYANRAHRLFRDTAKAASISPLLQVYIGMSSSFQAKMKTVFGLGDLEAMKNYFNAIPEDHPDWLVRFLRGTTLYKVGKELPPLFFFTEAKKEATRLGTADLMYVLYRHEEEQTEIVNLSDYDRIVRPVPKSVRTTILLLMKE